MTVGSGGPPHMWSITTRSWHKALTMAAQGTAEYEYQIANGIEPLLHLSKHKSTKGHRSKIAGIPSLDTNTLTIPYCNAAMQNRDWVCSDCYAARGLLTYISKANKKYQYNTEILGRPMSDRQKHIISREIDLECAKHGIDVCRFNAFGELINSQHAENIFEICNLTPDVSFGLYTKRLNLLTGAKPANLSIIFSNPRLNEPLTTVPSPEWTDFVFNVVTKEYAKETNLSTLGQVCRIDCPSCAPPWSCYLPDKDVWFIVEVLR